MDVIERWEWELMVERQRDVELQRWAEQEREAMFIQEFAQEMALLEIQEMFWHDEREWTYREVARMRQHDEREQENIEREQENCERDDMDLEDHDVSDAVIWERNVRPRF